MRNRRSHKYYLLGSSVPVRVTLNADGLKIGAEAPDRETGRLVIRNSLLSRLEQSPEVEEIDEDEFNRRCREFADRAQQ